MRALWFHTVLACGLLFGCSGESSIKPAEMLDESTGMTVGALEDPLEFLQTLRIAEAGNNRRPSFAYLGPIEWDQMGHSSYGLWLHVAPGNDRQVTDIRSSNAVTLELDDGFVILTPIDAPQPGRNPYRPVAPWGQSAYFQLDETLLKRMSTSKKLTLNILGIDAPAVAATAAGMPGGAASSAEFVSTHDNRSTLTQFARARGITLD